MAETNTDALARSDAILLLPLHGKDPGVQGSGEGFAVSTRCSVVLSIRGGECYRLTGSSKSRPDRQKFNVSLDKARESRFTGETVYRVIAEDGRWFELDFVPGEEFREFKKKMLFAEDSMKQVRRSSVRPVPRPKPSVLIVETQQITRRDPKRSVPKPKNTGNDEHGTPVYISMIRSDDEDDDDKWNDSEKCVYTPLVLPPNCLLGSSRKMHTPPEPPPRSRTGSVADSGYADKPKSESPDADHRRRMKKVESELRNHRLSQRIRNSERLTDVVENSKNRNVKPNSSPNNRKKRHGRNLKPSAVGEVCRCQKQLPREEAAEPTQNRETEIKSDAKDEVIVRLPSEPGRKHVSPEDPRHSSRSTHSRDDKSRTRPYVLRSESSPDTASSRDSTLDKLHYWTLPSNQPNGLTDFIISIDLRHPRRSINSKVTTLSDDDESLSDVSSVVLTLDYPTPKIIQASTRERPERPERPLWKCTVCKTVNTNDVIECRGNWTCPMCTKLNECTIQQCSVCSCRREAAFDRTATVREKHRVMASQQEIR